MYIVSIATYNVTFPHLTSKEVYISRVYLILGIQLNVHQSVYI